MQYIPKLKPEEIEQNHRHFSERISLYKKRGLDLLRSREFILEKANDLQDSILEVGSGNGYTTVVLAKAGYQFVAIDNDRESLKTTVLNLAYANVLPRVKFYVMDGKSLDFADNSFRNVVNVGLLHHIDDVDKMFTETDRVLCANGKLILADFNKNGMAIINSVHREEGRIHQDSGINRDYVYSYFHRLGYEIKSYEDRCHWVLICEKEICP